MRSGRNGGRALTGEPVRGRRSDTDPLALLPRFMAGRPLAHRPARRATGGFAPARVPTMICWLGRR